MSPVQLLGTILTDIKTLPKGYGRTSFMEGRRAMEKLTEELVGLAERKLGRRRAKKLRRDISFFRNFAGTREYPKYFWVCRYDIYKQALQRTAEDLAAKGELREPGDLYYLDLEELQSLLRTGKAYRSKIERRRGEYRRFARLTPPRLMFSDGEVPEPDRRDGLPAGALTGLGVSAGIVEGRARGVRSLGEAIMEKGDILVTAFTDPSWTPVFVSISGLVTEVGGMMTHGAVITREYGLPAVVGVADATRLIHDGDRIRLDGEMGFVQILLN